MPYQSVLIIEDDYGRMKLCRTAFQIVSPKTRITSVDNLSDALKSITTTKYDLYVCDCDFPRLSNKEDPKHKVTDGAFFEFYDSLLKVHPDARIVVCSCLEKNVKRAKELGLAAHLKGQISLLEIANGKL